MKKTRFFIAIIAGILVCYGFDLFFPNNIITIIIGILTALIIADPDRTKIGVFMGALVYTGFMTLKIKSVLASVYDPGIHTLPMLILGIILGLAIAFAFGAGLGFGLYKILQYFKKNKVML